MTGLAWQRLAAAVEYYKGLGFEYLEVPWLVGRAAMLETCSEDRLHEVFNGDSLQGHLVGSGEQGFIELIYDRELGDGNYMTITPCHRVEDVYDDKFTLPYFMKLELFAWDMEPSVMAVLAQKFFQRWYSPIDLVVTSVGYDLQYRTLEIGSYGRRELVEGSQFTYGTGLAEPRFDNIRGTL